MQKDYQAAKQTTIYAFQSFFVVPTYSLLSTPFQHNLQLQASFPFFVCSHHTKSSIVINFFFSSNINLPQHEPKKQQKTKLNRYGTTTTKSLPQSSSTSASSKSNIQTNHRLPGVLCSVHWNYNLLTKLLRVLR